MMFVIVRWTDKAGTHSGMFPNYKEAAAAAKKLSRELRDESVSVRQIDTGHFWARFLNGRKVVW